MDVGFCVCCGIVRMLIDFFGYWILGGRIVGRYVLIRGVGNWNGYLLLLYFVFGGWEGVGKCLYVVGILI